AFLGDDLAGPADLGPDSGHHPWPLRKAASVTVRIEADWLGHEDLQRLLAILGSAGEEARIAGGAVRNALIGEKVADIDIATTCLPNEVSRRSDSDNLRTVPTDIANGTVTVIAGRTGYELSTLREDVATAGRRAQVRSGRDWKADACR